MTGQSRKLTSPDDSTRPGSENSVAPASPDHPGPAVSRHQLGARLRQYRQDGGFRLEDAAAGLGIAPSTLSRIETGKAPARIAYLDVLINLYRIDNPVEKRQLTDLARRGRGSDWHAPYRDLLPAGAGPYLTLEAEADSIRILATQAIPLLLATPAYASAVCQASQPPPARHQIRDLGALIARRQELADTTGLTLHLILDEATLLRAVGDTQIQAGQLAHLNERIASPLITIQVLPIATAWPALITPFSLLTFANSVPPAGCTVSTPPPQSCAG